MLASAKCRRNIISWVLQQGNIFCRHSRWLCRTIISSFSGWNRHQLPASKRFNLLILSLFAWSKQKKSKKTSLSHFGLTRTFNILALYLTQESRALQSWGCAIKHRVIRLAVDHEIQVTLHRFVFEASSRIQRRQTTKFAKSNYFSVVLAFEPLDNLSSNKFLISARETLQMMIDNRLRAIFLTVEKPPLLPTLCHNFAFCGQFTK